MAEWNTYAEIAFNVRNEFLKSPSKQFSLFCPTYQGESTDLMSPNQCILFKFFTQVQNPAELRFYKALYFYAQLR